MRNIILGTACGIIAAVILYGVDPHAPVWMGAVAGFILGFLAGYIVLRRRSR